VRGLAVDFDRILIGIEFVENVSARVRLWISIGLVPSRTT
jgi:hypothetical protein